MFSGSFTCAAATQSITQSKLYSPLACKYRSWQETTSPSQISEDLIMNRTLAFTSTLTLNILTCADWFTGLLTRCAVCTWTQTTFYQEENVFGWDAGTPSLHHLGWRSQCMFLQWSHPTRGRFIVFLGASLGGCQQPKTLLLLWLATMRKDRECFCVPDQPGQRQQRFSFLSFE